MVKHLEHRNSRKFHGHAEFQNIIKIQFFSQHFICKMFSTPILSNSTNKSIPYRSCDRTPQVVSVLHWDETVPPVTGSKYVYVIDMWVCNRHVSVHTRSHTCGTLSITKVCKGFLQCSELRLDNPK